MIVFGELVMFIRTSTTDIVDVVVDDKEEIIFKKSNWFQKFIAWIRKILKLGK
jgi:hypothetical protein